MVNFARGNCGVSQLIDIRRYWVASLNSGNEHFEELIQEELRSKSFEPVLFRLRDGREKGVDITLTKEMLVNAFHHNYDVAVLVAGDEDYVELVREVKRYGVVVCGAFFQKGRSKRLQLACDKFVDLEAVKKDARYVELSQAVVEEVAKASPADATVTTCPPG